MQSSLPVWKQILRQNFFDLSKLIQFLELSDQQCSKLLLRPRFALNLPLRLAQKIVKGDLNDPILKQFIPTHEENVTYSNFQIDPVGDSSCRQSRKLLHKYQGRVLLLCSGACAMHCRFCFRQNFDYEVASKEFNDELQYIADDASIHEVILSGGDPLSLDDRVLEKLLRGLSEIPHVTKIRFHTRFPIGIPERIDSSFLGILEKIGKQCWFIVHVNHIRELDDDILRALKSIHKLGIPVLSQSVLLRGVNDSVIALQQLFSALVDNGIMPYYLHQLDRVQGSGHFEVSEEVGREIMTELTKKLPGYAVPKYVKEVAGIPSKTLI